MDNYSVLMSVYYKENPEYLRQAMESMWNQTKVTDDFVLVCDGPLNEDLNAVIDEMEREHAGILHVIKVEKNSGLGNALNEGLKHCRNEIVARMDSDDISCTDRCERQLSVFRDYPEVDICSGTIVEFNDSPDNIVGRRELPITDKQINFFSKKRNPFNHPAVMFKKDAVELAGGYDEQYHLFEDYYLWVRMLMSGAKGRNIKESILFMRTPSDLYKRRGGWKYAKDMLAFHSWMRNVGWSNWIDFLTGAVGHSLICVMPNKLRKLIYEGIHS